MLWPPRASQESRGATEMQRRRQRWRCRPQLLRSLPHLNGPDTSSIGCRSHKGGFALNRSVPDEGHCSIGVLLNRAPPPRRGSQGIRQDATVTTTTSSPTSSGMLRFLPFPRQWAATVDQLAVPIRCAIDEVMLASPKATGSLAQRRPYRLSGDNPASERLSCHSIPRAWPTV